ncbi:MAG: helix-turn-helix transcriptional regulator, partial [Kiritimatiellae bacterium]|nr:helix-turn-helix transcriptional regulator [Kiritimatiellia bacterium]
MDELLTTGKAKKTSICGVKRIAERETTRDLSGAARLVTAAEKYINANACQGMPPSPKGLLPSALAAALKVSRRYLEIRFKEVKGEGIAEAIRRRKLEEVCRLLRETDLPIGEIAARVSFGEPRSLANAFRRRFGSGMREWRKAIRNGGPRIPGE